MSESSKIIITIIFFGQVTTTMTVTNRFQIRADIVTIKLIYIESTLLITF